MDEREAIERLKGDDAGGIEVLVRTYQLRAVRAAYLIVRDRSLAEDIVQNAFVRAYERIAQFDPERPFGPWFMKTVVNDAVKAASRRELTCSLESSDTDIIAAGLADPDPGPHEVAEQEELRRRVWEALKELPLAQRAAVVQRYYLGMNEAEMAGDTTTPPGTIKWRLYAARKSLSKMLGFGTEEKDRG